MRNRVDFTFKTNKSPFIECGLGDTFYVLVYGENTVVFNNKSEKICYPIPVHYPSFVVSFNGRQTNFEEIFIFNNEEDKEKMRNFVRNSNLGQGKIIREFVGLK
ncbi:uncharacterized protein VNE69_02283 [Vairimorpha necatrix]|uniref:Uncharacterized protein n=1 Tax=Vairimorpha necatrix TaxID=6039 RepID=A0AAX4J9V9_9MICR